jgi:hypothetical protein
MNYIPKEGAEKLVASICNLRRYQLDTMGKRTFRDRIVIFWKRLVIWFLKIQSRIYDSYRANKY